MEYIPDLVHNSVSMPPDWLSSGTNRHTMSPVIWKTHTVYHFNKQKMMQIS